MNHAQLQTQKSLFLRKINLLHARKAELASLLSEADPVTLGLRELQARKRQLQQAVRSQLAYRRGLLSQQLQLNQVIAERKQALKESWSQDYRVDEAALAQESTSLLKDGQDQSRLLEKAVFAKQEMLAQRSINRQRLTELALVLEQSEARNLECYQHLQAEQQTLKKKRHSIALADQAIQRQHMLINSGQAKLFEMKDLRQVLGSQNRQKKEFSPQTSELVREAKQRWHFLKISEEAQRKNLTDKQSEIEALNARVGILLAEREGLARKLEYVKGRMAHAENYAERD